MKKFPNFKGNLLNLVLLLGLILNKIQNLSVLPCLYEGCLGFNHTWSASIYQSMQTFTWIQLTSGL